MFANIHQHIWEVVRTVRPYQIGWGIACKQCKTVLLHGLPKNEVEDVLRKFSRQVETVEAPPMHPAGSPGSIEERSGRSFEADLGPEG